MPNTVSHYRKYVAGFSPRRYGAGNAGRNRSSALGKDLPMDIVVIAIGFIGAVFFYRFLRSRESG
jgi:hypothetical protein